MRAIGAPVELLSPSSVTDVFPDVQAEDLLFVVHEPGAGILRAAEAVRVLVQRALRRGATLIRGTAVPASDAVVVDGRRFTADRIVWACGAWLGTLFSDSAPVSGTHQDVFYWDTPPSWDAIPPWADQLRGIYGFPDIDGEGAKILFARPGPPINLHSFARVPDLRLAAPLTHYAAHRFPRLGSVRLLRAAVMHYEMTPTEDFLIGPISASERTWLMGGGSGHGFKHGPALADYLADVFEERATLATHLIRPGQFPQPTSECAERDRPAPASMTTGQGDANEPAPALRSGRVSPRHRARVPALSLDAQLRRAGFL